MARAKFAGGDQSYLRHQQYSDSSRLTARGSLHEKYTTAAVPWFEWVSQQMDLFSGARVLEVGCGPGWLWEHMTSTVRAGIDLTLSDLSEGMLREALSRVHSVQQFTGVVGCVADAQALPFASRSFDRVIANHMLYHLPDPAAGVAELARVVTLDGAVIVATNGRRHLRELGHLRAEIFGIEPLDETVTAFGPETGFPILRDHFSAVAWHQYDDELHCTDPEDVMSAMCSCPPAEDATSDQLAELRRLIGRAFEEGDGTMRISKDTGCFVCRRTA